MKKLAAFTVIIFCAFAAKAQNVTVTAHIKTLPAGKWVYYREQGGNNAFDSAKSKAGGFSFKINIPAGSGNLYYFFIGKDDKNEDAHTDLFLDKGNVVINGSGPLFKDITVTGNPFFNEMKNYGKTVEMNSTVLKLQTLYNEANGYYTTGDTADFYRVRAEMDSINQYKLMLQKRWIINHPSTPMSVLVMYYMRNGISMDTVAALFNGITDEAKDNLPAKALQKSIAINQLTGIGKAAPQFTQTDTAGVPVSLESFRGKYVLLDFWASWCGPCREENPNVVAAYNMYKDKNFTVLSVSLDQPNGKEKWLAAIHHDGLNWTHVSDLQFWNNAVARAYDIESIPSNFLLDPNGIIIAKNLRGEDLNNTLQGLLK